MSHKHDMHLSLVNNEIRYIYWL